jgi:predicted HAD superfamily Cof-like phosphohydrolase
MKKEQNDVREFCRKAGQPTPDTPTKPTIEDRKLRARLILEEALELINDGLGLEVLVHTDSGYAEILTEDDIDFQYVKQPDLVQLADGAADLWYVGVAGVSVLCGFDICPVVAEVTRSNMSKFTSGYSIRDDGKLLKGKDYSPASLEDKILPIGVREA